MKHATRAARDGTGDRCLVRRVSARAVVFGLLPLILCSGSVDAQGGEQWTSPTVLSQGDASRVGESLSFTAPALAADDWGAVHAIWTGCANDEQAAGERGCSLYYSVLDDQSWSEPVDILYQAEGNLWLPKVTADSRGRLWLAWMAGATGQVSYAWALADQAGDARAWSPASPLSAGSASGFAISSDDNGGIHAVYCGLGGAAGVYYAGVDADGAVSTPVFVGDTGNAASTNSECRLGLDLDARRRLHVVWGQSLGVHAPVFYSRSDDGGQSWLRPVEVDRKDGRYAEEYAPGRPNLVAVGTDEIHLVWFGAPAGQRWHQWSRDGGDTWSSPEQISADLRGFCEPPSMAVDGSGTVHLVSSGFFAAYHASWHDVRWSPLTLIEDVSGDVDGGGEFLAVAVSSGSTLHVLGDYGGFKHIWTSSLAVDALPLPVERRPTTPSGAAVLGTESDTVSQSLDCEEAGRSTAVAVAGDAAEAVPKSSTSPGRALLLAVVPSMILVGLTAFVRWRHGRG